MFNDKFVGCRYICRYLKEEYVDILNNRLIYIYNFINYYRNVYIYMICINILNCIYICIYK